MNNTEERLKEVRDAVRAGDFADDALAGYLAERRPDLFFNWAYALGYLEGAVAWGFLKLIPAEHGYCLKEKRD